MHHTTSRPGDAGPHLQTHQVQPQPLVGVVELVVENDWRAAIVHHHDIRASVIIHVSHSESASWIARSKGGSAQRTYVVETLAVVVKEKKRFLIVQRAGNGLDQVVGMTVRHDDVWPTIQVIVEKSDPPAGVHDGGHRDAGCPGYVVEAIVFLIVIEGKLFPADIGHEEILKAVLIIVNCVDPHAGSCGAFRAVGHSRCEPDLFELAPALVEKKKVGNRIVGHEQVEQSVIVDVRSHYAERFAGIV